MSKFMDNLGNLMSKPLFWGVTGGVVLGGVGYYITRDNEDKTVIAKKDTTASTDTSTTPPVVTTPTVTQTATPNLVSLTLTELTYSNVANGAILTLYANGVSTGQTKTADGNAWTGFNISLNLTYKLSAMEGTKTESALSNGIEITQTATPNLIAITSTQLSYSNVTNGSLLTLYANDVSTGLTKTANGNPWTGLSNILNTTYKLVAKNGNNRESSLSNGVKYVQIIVPPSGSVTIIEPNFPQYYFTDGKSPSFYANRNNLPVIRQNSGAFDSVNDVVKMSNGVIEVWFDLRKGGQICLFRLVGTNTNAVYYGYDGGFEWQWDSTTKIVGGVINGQTSSSPQNNVNYNTTQGGSHTNRCPNVLVHNAIQDGYYFKIRPILYPFNDIMAEVEIEITYTLINDLLKVDYNYVSFRTDPHIQLNTIAQDFVVPVMFCVNNYDRYLCLNGPANSGWTNLPVSEGEIPNCTNGQNTPIGFNNPELWGSVYDPNTNMAIGVYNGTGDTTSKFLKFEQLNKFAGSGAGTPSTGPYTVLSLNDSSFVANAGNFSKSSTAYITMKPKNQIRQRFKDLAGA